MINHTVHNSYSFDIKNSVWVRDDYAGIAYSDGSETENHLKSIVDNANDLSVMSTELANECKDWPTTYHLTRKRSNLLRPFGENFKDCSVLEIGSGCGAISRFIGETGANLTALEGSIMRASIGASRCRDLDNVAVISDNFQSFETEQQFDFVTLIGVLEYARHFVDGDDPIAEMLTKAKSYLKPNGVLIIAIENQLGLKYFAGYPEDHTGKPMYGIEEHYSNNTVVTFGKKELGQRVAQAGLGEQAWWYPFPDYKMPSLLVSESGADTPNNFDLTTLVRGTCFSDRQTPEAVNFLQERAWTPVIKNGLLEDMANSFVLLASQNKIGDMPDYYAVHYAIERRSEFSKQVIFSVNESGETAATQSNLYPELDATPTELEQVLDIQNYVVGESWQDNLINIMSTPGWSVNDIAQWWGYWWESLQKHVDELGQELLLSGDIDGTLIDAMPRNLFCVDDQQSHFIDLEWNYRGKISTRFFIFRALLSSFQSLGICAEPKGETPLHVGTLIELVLKARKIQFTTEEIDGFIQLEGKIQTLATGVIGLTPQDYQRFTIRTFDTLLPASHIAQLKNQLRQSQDVNKQMRNSLGWKITKPLRGIRPLLGKIKNWKQTSFVEWAKHQVLRVIHVVSLVLSAIRMSGGVKGLLQKVYYVFRNQGFSGIKQSLAIFFGSRTNYKKWIEYYDTLNDEKRAVIRQRIENLDQKPLISVVMPTYNPNPEWLAEAIESVQGQLYPNWELCIADDLSTNDAIRPLLEKFSQNDSRIKIVFREENGHISAATNSAIELVAGDWIALMDHDDILPEHALYWVADAINNNPDARLIYSDEDKIDQQGNRYAPYFKSNWNPDLFYSYNMFSHLGVYHTELMKEVNGFRVGFEGSQDYDLVLRCIEKVGSDQIHHIPHVLYHWRSHDESTSQSMDAKPYVVSVGQQALSEHFERSGVDVDVSPVRFGYRVSYKLPAEPPLVSLIIPTRNGLTLIKQCIESILEKTSYPHYEIIIVDNGSDDPAALDYFDSLASNTKIRVHRDDRPFNYSQLNNSAVELANGEVIALINNDIEVISSDWLSEMVSHALRPTVGAVGAKLWYPDNTLQHGGVVLGLGGCAGHSHAKYLKASPGYFGRLDLVSNYTAVTAACLVIEKSIYQEVGGLNESDLKIAFNDVDFCLRVKEAGYWNVWTPHAELYHHESATRGEEDTPEKQARFNSEVDYMTTKWESLLTNDPAYSPNLTFNYEDFSYAWPPRVDYFSE